MKPRLLYRHGMWVCAGRGAWGAGDTIMEAWESWRYDFDHIGAPA